MSSSHVARLSCRDCDETTIEGTSSSRRKVLINVDILEWVNLIPCDLNNTLAGRQIVGLVLKRTTPPEASKSLSETLLPCSCLFVCVRYFTRPIGHLSNLQ